MATLIQPAMDQLVWSKAYDLGLKMTRLYRFWLVYSIRGLDNGGKVENLNLTLQV